jgi:hypothetical protein
MSTSEACVSESGAFEWEGGVRNTSFMVRSAGRFTLATACLFFGAIWPGESRAQSDNPAGVQYPPAKHRKVTQPAPTIRPVPAATAVGLAAMPVADPSSPLGNAVAHQCSRGSDASEFVVPGAKGDIKLDRCYRGRDQLVCEFNALTAEAKSLLENYRQIVATNYPEIQDIGGMCQIQSDSLANDIQGAKDFADRFKALKFEYDARSACARRIEQSFKEVTLSDLAQAPNLLKSILDNLEAEIKAVSDMQGQISEFAEKMASSQRAMGTLQKVHRAVCMTGAPPKEQVSR